MSTFEWLSIIIPNALVLFGIAGGLIRWIMKLNKKIDNMFDAINKIAADVGDIHKIQGTMLGAQKASLEAMQGKINGNVESALKEIEGACGEYRESINRNMKHTI